jgi:EipB-like
MLKPIPVSCALLAVIVAGPVQGQDLAPHRAAYKVTVTENGKPGLGGGTYAYELRATCDGYVMNQRLRIDLQTGRGPLVSEQQSQLTEGREGRKLHFDHRGTTNGKTTNTMKGEANIADDGQGQARFSEPDGQTVALPAGTMFPAALSRVTVQHFKAGDTSFDVLFFLGDKVKPPQSVNVLIGKQVPKRLADLEIPKEGESLVNDRQRIYYRGGFFDTDAKDKSKGEQATFEMSSLMLDNGIELYGTHEEADGTGFEYRITRLEPLPKPACN